MAEFTLADIKELEEWGAHVVSVVTDNASNMIPMATLLKTRVMYVRINYQRLYSPPAAPEKCTEMV